MKLLAVPLLLCAASLFAAEPAPVVREIPPIRLNLDRKEAVQKAPIQTAFTADEIKTLKVVPGFAGLNASHHNGKKILAIGDTGTFRVNGPVSLEVEIRFNLDKGEPALFLTTSLVESVENPKTKKIMEKRSKVTTKVIEAVAARQKKTGEKLKAEEPAIKDRLAKIVKQNEELEFQYAAFKRDRRERLNTGDADQAPLNSEERVYVDRYEITKRNLKKETEAGRERLKAIVIEAEKNKAESESTQSLMKSLDEIASKCVITLKATTTQNGTETVIAQTKEPAK